MKLCNSQGHRNIVSVIEHGKYDESIDRSYYFIDMEYCELDLNRYIYRQWTSVVEKKLPFFTMDRPARMKMWQIWDIMHDILNGLCFIHSHDQVHRDIKPRNSNILPTICFNNHSSVFISVGSLENYRLRPHSRRHLYTRTPDSILSRDRVLSRA